MADLGQDGGLLAAKAVGSVAGAWVSLVYLVPRSAREAASRFMTGVSCGVMFGGPAGLWLTARLGLAGQLSPVETTLTGAAAASLSAWWVLGILTRFANRYGTKVEPPP
ncbi:DUF6107 family protein [Rhizobium sp. SSA_523]|uniref:DUF6107 family protein n=1 Tax=Rhizobium sp. SSA_523 TaxID=2952477 RepID=UPI002091C1B8|nr:DUF6107 family protein [Rhizobium sp. SSA_523]MCO5730911.1 DUF6107 family protein [Rhizobium sp. SSA_523]WKC24276.1 DUF6107 family protein [Rhizobium sp. SSA_523]